MRRLGEGRTRGRGDDGERETVNNAAHRKREREIIVKESLRRRGEGLYSKNDRKKNS